MKLIPLKTYLRSRIQATLITLFTLLSGAAGLFGAPAVLGIRTEPVLDNEGRLTGELGTGVAKLFIDFNKEVDINTVRTEDFEIVGISGDATGKTLTHQLWSYDIYLEDKLPVELGIGPLDSSANGEYSIRVKEGEIGGTGENPTFIPAGEIARFTQDITDPLPAVLPRETWDGIHDIDSDQISSFSIYFNTVVDPDSLDRNDVIVTGISPGNLGVVLPVMYSHVYTSNDPYNGSYVNAFYYFSDELREDLNGDFKVEIAAGQVLDGKNPPNAVPAGLVDTFTQDVIDPFRVVVNGRIYEETGVPSLIDDGYEVDPGLFIQTQMEVYKGPALRSGYHDVHLGNHIVGTDRTGLAFPISTAVAGGPGAAASGSFIISGDQIPSLQVGDTFLVVGSTGNDGTYTVKDFVPEYEPTTRSTVTVEEMVPSPVADGTITKVYTADITIDGTPIPISITGIDAQTYDHFFSQINAQLGGAGAAFFKRNDSYFRIKSASQGDSSSVLINEPNERTGLFSSLTDYYLIDEPVEGGDEFTEGYQDVSLWVPTTNADPTNLLRLPITTVVASGGGASGSFTISGDQSESLKMGDTFSIVGSTGNDGTYTVTTVENFFGVTTTVGVSEAVPSGVADGTITKVYTSDVSIDGIPIPISIIGIEAQTFENLISQINTQLGGAAAATFIEDGQKLRIQSASAGDSSTVFIDEPDPRKGLFSTLSFGYPPLPPVPGTDRYLEGYQIVHMDRYTEPGSPSGLISYPITTAVPGAAMNGSFIVSGDQTQPLEFNDPSTVPLQAGDTFSVIGSTGNNGSYTVKTTVFLEGEGHTRIGVEEPVASSAADGTITKVYSADIIIDGTRIPLSVTGTEAQTFEDLLSKLNNLLGNAGKAIFLHGQNEIKIESATDGTTSFVSIKDPGGRTGLFSNLLYTSFSSIYGPVGGSDGWRESVPNEFTPQREEDDGIFRFTVREPGQYRIRAHLGEFYDPESNLFEFIALYPEWVVQTLGDPSREGAPKDHFMYVTITEDMKGQTITRNFSYVEEHDSPEAIIDDADYDPNFTVLRNAQSVRLDVLKNDTVNGQPAKPGELTIIGVGLNQGPFTGTSGTGTQDSVVTTDGTFVYFTPQTNFVGWVLFYYTIEDIHGNRDFAEVYVAVAFTIANRFAANDDFATVPVTSTRARINVLANDTVTGGVSREQLVITDIATTTQAGGTVTFQGTDVFYQPPPGFLGVDTFEYTMTDNYSGTDTAKVSVSVTELPHSLQLEALLRMLLRLFGGSHGGSAVFAFFNNHISELNFLIMDQGEGSVEAKANGNPPRLRLQAGGTAGTQARWNAILNLAEPGIAAMLAGQGDSAVVTQELVDKLMSEIEYLQEHASPEFKADLQKICDMTNDFQDLVGKTFNEGFTILGLPPENISIPNLALQRIDDVISISIWNIPGLAYKLWKSNNLQPDSWQEVQNAAVEKEGLTAKISDPDIGEDDVFYRVTSEVE